MVSESEMLLGNYIVPIKGGLAGNWSYNWQFKCYEILPRTRTVRKSLTYDKRLWRAFPLDTDWHCLHICLKSWSIGVLVLKRKEWLKSWCVSEWLTWILGSVPMAQRIIASTTTLICKMVIELYYFLFPGEKNLHFTG